MKKLLFLSSRVPYPLVGGDKIRVFNSLKILSKKYKVDLLYIDTSPICSNTELELSKYCNFIKPVVVPKYSYHMNTLFGLISNTKPLQVNYYYYRKIQKWIDRNIGEYDAVYCNHIRTTEYVRNYSILKFVDLVDSIAMNYTKAFKQSSGLWKLIYGIEKHRVKQYELNIVKEFDKSILISDVDKDFVDVDNKYDINVISNFVPNLDFDENIKPVPYKVCFLGKMDYEPNVSATFYFVNNIFPILRNRFHGFSFKIIGAHPLDKIKALEKIDGIQVTGFVDNPYNEIQDCQLFIAPMVSGAGVQNKILEAMKMGKCVITTKIGSEGLNNLSGNELVICDNDNDMIHKITNLLSNEKQIREIGNNAKKYISMNFSEDKIGKLLLDYISEE